MRRSSQRRWVVPKKLRSSTSLGSCTVLSVVRMMSFQSAVRACHHCWRAVLSCSMVWRETVRRYSKLLLVLPELAGVPGVPFGSVPGAGCCRVLSVRQLVYQMAFLSSMACRCSSWVCSSRAERSSSMSLPQRGQIGVSLVSGKSQTGHLL